MMEMQDLSESTVYNTFGKSPKIEPKLLSNADGVT